MNKINFVCADPNEEYLRGIADYLRTSSYSTLVNMRQFSNSDKLEHFLDSRQPVHVLIVSSAFRIKDLEQYEHIQALAWLDEDDYSAPHRADQLPVIYKYQSLYELFEQVVMMYEAVYGSIGSLQGNENRAQVVSIYSTTGGVGKTTFATYLTRQLAQHKRIFYLNLETVHSTALFFENNSAEAAQMLYHVKAHPEVIKEKILQYKSTDLHSGVDLFQWPVHMEEMVDLTVEHVQHLIEGIIQSGKYDYVFIDLESGLNARIQAAFQCSDIILWLFNQDAISFFKTDQMLAQWPSIMEVLDLSKKTKLILNRYTGNLPHELEKYNLPVTAFLPYIPEWKNVGLTEDLLHMPVYEQELARMMPRLFQSEVLAW